jgi:hypothetical protein
MLARMVRARRVWLLYEYDAGDGYPVDKEYYGFLRDALKVVEATAVAVSVFIIACGTLIH